MVDSKKNKNQTNEIAYSSNMVRAFMNTVEEHLYLDENENALINAEIKTIYIVEPYEDKLAQELLAEAEVEMNIVDRDTGILKKLL